MEHIQRESVQKREREREREWEYSELVDGTVVFKYI